MAMRCQLYNTDRREGKEEEVSEKDEDDEVIYIKKERERRRGDTNSVDSKHGSRASLARNEMRTAEGSKVLGSEKVRSREARGKRWEMKK